jgi:alpha-L-rhamnosidase
MDCYPVFSKWLGDCRKLQHEDGKVAMIAPVINRPGFMTNMLAGSAGWGDASILVPLTMYRRTGDIRILEENYSLMQRWFTFLENRTKGGKLKKLLKKTTAY